MRGQAQFIAEDNTYRLVSKRGKEIIQKPKFITFKEDGKIAVNREGIAYELGIVDKDASPEVASKQAKEELGLITIFFMIAYGFSQLFFWKII